MIKITRNTLFNIMNGNERASTTSANRSRLSRQAYNTYLNTSAWAAVQTITNDMTREIARTEMGNNYIDTRSYTIDTESLRRYLDVSLESDTVLATIDDRAPHIEITEQKLLEFLNGKDDSDANI